VWKEEKRERTEEEEGESPPNRLEREAVRGDWEASGVGGPALSEQELEEATGVGELEFHFH